MTNILTKITPNNKLQIKAYRLGDGYFRKRGGGDTEKERQQEYLGRKIELIERYERAIKSSSTIETERFYQSIGTQIGLTSKDSAELPVKTQITAKYCTLPESIPVLLENENCCTVDIEYFDYYELRQSVNSSLDLLKKSQYTAQKERPWGKNQKPKEFRYQAGEKIKEGGAVIDRFAGTKNAHMVTLTLPGDTPEAMNALSRWSGWIVNRLIQVIRNQKKDYKNIYWFFVWEHQNRGALHLHFCLGWKTFWLKRENLAHKLKDKFYELLFEIGTKESIDMFSRSDSKGSWSDSPDVWRWDIQRVRKSVAAYFAKYCQKNRVNQYANGQKQDRRRPGNDFPSKSKNVAEYHLYPSRYWGSSGTVKKWCKLLTKQHAITTSSEAETEHYLAELRRKIGEVFSFKGIYKNPFQLELEGSDRVIASGVVETYIVDSGDFVDFWIYCMDAIIGRPPDRIDGFKEFLLTQKRNFVDPVDSLGWLVLT